MRRKDRGEHDHAGVGPDPARAGRLIPLRDARDFKFAAGEPDIRGWEVRTLSGRRIGAVDELMIDADRGEVVMMDVDLRDDSGKHVEVPLRFAQIDRQRHCVLVDSADVEERGFTIDDRDRLDRDVRDEAVGDAQPYVSTDPRSTSSDSRTLSSDGDEEIVVERRPVVMEEVVVRRRVVDEDER